MGDIVIPKFPHKFASYVSAVKHMRTTASVSCPYNYTNNNITDIQKNDITCWLMTIEAVKTYTYKGNAVNRFLDGTHNWDLFDYTKIHKYVVDPVLSNSCCCIKNIMYRAKEKMNEKEFMLLFFRVYSSMLTTTIQAAPVDTRSRTVYRAFRKSDIDIITALRTGVSFSSRRFMSMTTSLDRALWFATTGKIDQVFQQNRNKQITDQTEIDIEAEDSILAVVNIHSPGVSMFDFTVDDNYSHFDEQEVLFPPGTLFVYDLSCHENGSKVCYDKYMPDYIQQRPRPVERVVGGWKGAVAVSVLTINLIAVPNTVSLYEPVNEKLNTQASLSQELALPVTYY